MVTQDFSTEDRQRLEVNYSYTTTRTRNKGEAVVNTERIVQREHNQSSAFSESGRDAADATKK